MKSFDDSEESFDQLDDVERYRFLFDNASDLIAVVDRKGNFIELNKKFEEESLYSREEMIGKNIFTSGIVTKKSVQKILSIFSKVIKGEFVPVIEVDGVTKHGDIVPYELRAVPLIKNNKVIAAQAILRNLTERKKTIYALTKNKRKYSEIFNRSRDGFVMVDDSGRIIDANDAYCRMLGFTGDELKNLRNFYEITPKKWREWEEKEIWNNRLLKQGYSGRYEKEYIRKDGTVFPVELESYLVRDQQGDIDYLWGVARDITDKKKAEQKIIGLKDFYEQILENVHDGIWVTNNQDIMVYFNPGIERISGVNAEKVLGSNVYHDFAPETIEHFIDYYEKAKQTGEPQQYEAEVVTPAGRTTFQTGWLIPRFDTDKKYQGMICTVVDNTERKRFQDELIENKKRLDLALEGGDLGTWDWNIQTDEVHFNRRWAEMLGYDLEEVKSNISTWKNLTHSKDLPKVRQVLDDHLNGKTPFYEAVFRMKHKSGDYIWILDKGKVIEWDEEGKPVRACGTHLDITHQKRIELELEESEEKYRLIFEMSPIVITTADKKGRIIDINQSGADITGHLREELIGKKYNELNFIDRKLLFKILKNHFSKIIRGEPLGPIEMDVVDLKGNTHIVEVRISPIRKNDKFAGTQVIMQDITERKKAEEEIQQANNELKKLNQTLEQKVKERTEQIDRLLKQKDEFINQLGHDLKNPLGPFLQLLPILEDHISDEKDKRMIGVLNRNANYMRNLVKKTIDLAKLNSSKTTFSFENVSLGDLVNEVVSVNSSLFDDHKVVVENNVSSDCLVYADPFHIQEVFTNLFNNALKYSEDERWIGITTVEKDDYVLVSVRDKGIGISDDQLPYLFNEYYKADSSRHDFDSSGLGLPICKRIIEKHGGHIWAESKGIGKGSTFYFTLPKSDKP